MVLIYIDQAEQQIKKSSLEAISYGAALAKQLGVSAEGILLGTVTDDLAGLGKYGLQKLHQVADANLNHFDAKVFTQVLTEAAKTANASVLVFAHNLNGKAIAPAVAVKLHAGIVTGANSLPDTSNGFTVTKTVFFWKSICTNQYRYTC